MSADEFNRSYRKQYQRRDDPGNIRAQSHATRGSDAQNQSCDARKCGNVRRAAQRPVRPAYRLKRFEFFGRQRGRAIANGNCANGRRRNWLAFD